MDSLKYLIVGLGGTGACLAGGMAQAGLDVTAIARGKHLEAIRRKGLTLHRPDGTSVITLKACSEEEYTDRADVILVCVKGYSLKSVVPLLRRASHEGTVVIPILNIYGTGEKLQPEIPQARVLNGCIYVAAAITAPGEITMSGKILRVVYGETNGRTDDPMLLRICDDLQMSGVEPVYSANIRRDTLQKFAFVSPMGAAGAYGGWTAEAYRRPGEAREMYIGCIREIDALANAMGIPFPVDIVETDLRIMDGLTPDATTSLQKDLARGGQSEADGLIAEVVRMGRREGVPVPCYTKIAEKLGLTI